MRLAFERVTNGTHVVENDRRYRAQTHGVDRTITRQRITQPAMSRGLGAQCYECGVR